MVLTKLPNSTQNIHVKENGRKNKSVPFGNAAFVSGMVRAMDVDAIVGATAVDVSSMVAPRVAIDMHRNPFAGVETMFREMAGVTVHAVIGLFGVAAAKILSKGFKNKHDIDISKIYANNDTIETFSAAWKNAANNFADKEIDKNATAKKYFQELFNNIEGLNGNSKNKEANLWKTLNNDTKDTIVEKLHSSFKTEDAYEIPKETLKEITSLITSETGAQKSIRIKVGDNTVKNELINVVKDSFSLSKAFSKDKFLTAGETVFDNMITDMKSVTNKKMAYGLSAICLIASSIQAFNRHMTKKRTGSDGFVGYSDYGQKHKKLNKAKNSEKNNSVKFWGFKAAAAGTMGLIIRSAIGGPLKEIPKKLQFIGKLPTVNQLKIVYGLTIVGRLLAASDKNELRETATRDYLGYTNWLILGGVVSKLFAKNINNGELINYEAPKKAFEDNAIGKIKKGIHWVTHSNLKTHDEIAYQDKNFMNNIDTLNKKKFKEIFTELGDASKSKIKSLNNAHLVGLAYSCAALGIMIPLVNKYVTDKNRQKELAQETNSLPPTQHNSNVMFLNRERLPRETKELFKEFIK